MTPLIFLTALITLVICFWMVWLLVTDFIHCGQEGERPVWCELAIDLFMALSFAGLVGVIVWSLISV